VKWESGEEEREGENKKKEGRESIKRRKAGRSSLAGQTLESLPRETKVHAGGREMSALM